MTIITSTIHKIECDRCNIVLNVPSGGIPPGWKWYYWPSNIRYHGKAEVEDGFLENSLCEKCHESFMNWWAWDKDSEKPGGEFDSGVHSVVMIRCMKHYKKPQLNENESGGGECGYCAYLRGMEKAAEEMPL